MSLTYEPSSEPQDSECGTVDEVRVYQSRFSSDRGVECLAEDRSTLEHHNIRNNAVPHPPLCDISSPGCDISSTIQFCDISSTIQKLTLWVRGTNPSTFGRFSGWRSGGQGTLPRRDLSRPRCATPTPYPTFCTLHPTPYTLHPTPYTLNPKP